MPSSQSEGLVPRPPVVPDGCLQRLIPLMTVVNYRCRETFGDNVFFWAGTGVVRAALHPGPLRCVAAAPDFYSPASFCTEVPLGIIIALHAACRKGAWVSVCLGADGALPLLIPWNVVGAMWNIFAPRHRPDGHF